MGRLPGLSLAISKGSPPYPGERAGLQRVIMIVLPQGVTPRFKASQKKEQKSKGLPTTLEKNPWTKKLTPKFPC